MTAAAAIAGAAPRERDPRTWQLVGLAAACAVVVAGKQLYRGASAAELGFVLAPTAHAVAFVTRTPFHATPGGWLDARGTFLIAPVCAGVNFALAAFLALVLGWRGAMRSPRAVVHRLALAAALAYAATLVVNTVRIAVAVGMHRRGLGGAGAHEAEGIVVYLGGLCALYALARYAERRAVSERLAWLAAPIAAYLAITLILPAAHGAVHRPAFFRHAGRVLAGCAAALAIVAITARAVRSANNPRPGRVPSPGDRA